MLAELSGLTGILAQSALPDWLKTGWLIVQIVVGFSIIIFVHELGHFLAAKWMGVRVDRFAIGFFYRLVGYRRGEGVTFGPRPTYSPEELAAKGYGETDYCFNALPFGGYVKMLGQDDIIINEETGEVKTGDDPRSFPNKSVGRRMVVVSAGVLFNALFAILLFALIFLGFGRQMQTARIGAVSPDSPAATAGLLPGDRVVAIDDSSVQSFDDLVMNWVLGGEQQQFRVERAGQPLTLTLQNGRKNGEREPLGIQPMFRAEIADRASTPGGPQPGDRIVAVDGAPMKNVLQILGAFENSHGRPVTLTVERPDPNGHGSVQTLDYAQQPLLTLEPAGPAQTDAARLDEADLLGLRQRRIVEKALPNSPGLAAGFEPEDVIVQWGTVANPLYGDILASVRASADQAIAVVVERAGQRQPLQVTPRRPFQLFGTSDPKVGIAFAAESQRIVVADVAEDSPAATLQMPRGAEILTVDTQPVHTWPGLAEALRAAAGRTVTLRYRSGTEEYTARMAVPSSIVNELNLPPTARLIRIAGEERATVPGGPSVSLPSPLAARLLFEQHIGQRVTVEYSTDLASPEKQTTTFAVRSDNTDPWQMRVRYAYTLDLAPEVDRVSAEGNPLTALAMGLTQTRIELWKVYRTAERMLTRNVGVQHVAGPIGILRFAYRQAEAGLGELLFILGFISINLAVINFLPLPVVDGGMMVFLLLEKIRGKPLSIKVQVATTLAGLALIVICFLFVTFQDISKWLGGSL